MAESLAPGAGHTIGFVGLGNMGNPMSRLLAEAGFSVRGYDANPAAGEALAGVRGFVPVSSPVEVTEGAAAVVLMLPNSDIVEQVVLDDGVLAAMSGDALLIDMSTSEPTRTRTLAARAADAGITMLDAPVSGGVPRATDGTLMIMVGGPDAPVGAARPMLDVLGSQVVHAGGAGAGHALKALNNLMSAAHLLASSEALLVGKEFGLDPAVMLDAVNGASGRSGSTENKWPNYVLTGRYDSGFGLRLMLKDLRIALGLAQATGAPAPLAQTTVDVWARAADEMPVDADHTEIARWLAQIAKPAAGEDR